MRNKLTKTKIDSLKKSGRHADGGGLYFIVTKTGSKSWAFMWTRDGKRREMGLGSYSTGTATVSLPAAREKAEEIRSILGRGGDPFTEMSERIAVKNAVDFGTVADRFIELMKVDWKNPKHEAAWRMTLSEYAAPIRGKAIDQITVDDVMQVIEPIWLEKNETASRLRGRIEKVIDHATARGLRTGDNPARWKGLMEQLLPSAKSVKSKRGHFAAMNYREAPEFLEKLKNHKGVGARALEFLIYTAARSGETLGAKWDEIDLIEKLWIIPAERMKAGKVHRVPLTEEAIKVLKIQQENRLSDYIFPGQAPRRPISNMTMSKALKSLQVENATVHGFRSSFRDWAGEETSFPREVAEQALAHVIGDETERAYRRGDALEKRRALMNAWSNFLNVRNDGVVKLHG